jgi:hypothetical protein
MDKGKKRCLNHFWYLLQRKKIRIFAHLNKFEFVSLGRVITQPWKAILHCTMTLQDMKTMKCGIDLILRIIPYLLQNEF